MEFLPGIAAGGCCSRRGNSGIIESNGLSRRETSLAPSPGIVEVIVKVRLTATVAICVALALAATGCVTTKSVELPIEVVNATLQSVADWESLQNTGAGVLPIVEFGEHEE